MHKPPSIASSTSPAPAAASAATPTPPERARLPERRTEVVVQIADDGPSMAGWVWAAELAQATQSPLRLLYALPPMPDVQDHRRVESWLSTRHLANARLTAALLAVRRRYPAVRVSSQLCTEGAALVVATRGPRTDTLVRPRP